MRRLFLAFACLAASALLSGCGALSALGEATEPLDAYDLRAPATGPVARGQPLARDLIVEVPNASGAIETDRILIRPNPLQAQYLPRARWSEPAPVMVQTLLLRSLENANALRYVARRPLSGAGDFALISDLTDFQAELVPGGEAAEIRLRLLVRIVREADSRILASRTFIATERAESLETLAIVARFDAAADTLLRDVTGWVMATLGIPATVAAPDGS